MIKVSDQLDNKMFFFRDRIQKGIKIKALKDVKLDVIKNKLLNLD